MHSLRPESCPSRSESVNFLWNYSFMLGLNVYFHWLKTCNAPEMSLEFLILVGVF